MRPKAFLKSKLESFLAQRGYALSRISPVPRVSSTIARLRPQSVGLELLRLGGESDGGYLVPDDLDDLSACFSPGVSDVADFELSLADGYGVRCHLADASVDGPPLSIPS